MKEIQLTQGKVALVDDQDFDYLNQWKWFAQYDKRSNSFYCMRWRGEKDGEGTRHIRMHRAILMAKKGEMVDHINHRTLDNRRENLRICDSLINNHNSGMPKTNKSGFVGVCFDTNRKKWKAFLHDKNKIVNLGRFEMKEEAIEARQKANIIYGFHENHGKIY